MRSKTLFTISVITIILVSASFLPAQIRAEEEIKEEPELIEEKNQEVVIGAEIGQAEEQYHIISFFMRSEQLPFMIFTLK